MTKELKLEHKQHCIDGNWYWICPICGEWLFPHEAGKGKGHYVLQSKGLATKHLISHNAGYIPKGESITEITSKNQYFCNDCGNYVISLKIIKNLNKDFNKIANPEHRFFCFDCCKYDMGYTKGLKTKDEVHKGKIK